MELPELQALARSLVISGKTEELDKPALLIILQRSAI
jgi:hypothetical protein